MDVDKLRMVAKGYKMVKDFKYNGKQLMDKYRKCPEAPSCPLNHSDEFVIRLLADWAVCIVYSIPFSAIVNLPATEAVNIAVVITSNPI